MNSYKRDLISINTQDSIGVRRFFWPTVHRLFILVNIVKLIPLVSVLSTHSGYMFLIITMLMQFIEDEWLQHEHSYI